MANEDEPRVMALGVVIEKRCIDNPWQEFTWHAVGAIPGAAQIDTWQMIREADSAVQYHAATLPLELYPRETEGYKDNLSAELPKIFVVLRPGEEKDDSDIVPFLVSACPYEAQDYLDSGEEIVEGVPMPDSVITWLSAFVDAHHVDEPFVKRKLKKYAERRPDGHRFGGGFNGGR